MSEPNTPSDEPAAPGLGEDVPSRAEEDDLTRAEQVVVNTANGQTVASRVKLDSVRVGEIVVMNVDAMVHSTEMPFALLGMSFLNRMEMQRDGDTMTLKKRY